MGRFFGRGRTNPYHHQEIPSESWWTEFNDHEWYRAGELASVSRPALPEPWREERGADSFFLLPVPLLRSLCQGETVDRILRTAHELEKVEWLRSDMAHRGLCHGLTLTISDSGQVCLSDGHHRVLAAEAMDEIFPTLPVRIEHSPGVRIRTMPFSELVRVLFAAAGWVPN